MFHRENVERHLAGVVQEHGVGLVVWSPLASGILTGKYNDGIPADSRLAIPKYEWLQEFVTEERVSKVRQLTELAWEFDATVAQLALAWLLRRSEVSSVITGATRAGHVHENLKAADLKSKLTPDVLARIEEILDNDPLSEA
jgi:aryl-alcohol dehydrogenase-like predicted oxidoreductase